MSPLHFEKAYAPLWRELESALDRLEPSRSPWIAKIFSKKTTTDQSQPSPLDGARLCALYRRSCEHLALAQARAYPVHLRDRLELLTQRAHRVVYRQQSGGWSRWSTLWLIDFPQSVRHHRAYLLVAFLLFVLPMLATGWACYKDAGFILHLVDAEQVRNFDKMYSSGAEAFGRHRSADTDWQMFGFYIRHNISIAFQCFAGGLLAGLGSVYCLIFNGVIGGGVAGYLTLRGHGENFYSFVVTHAAFELTAIVLAGAAGLRLGHALLMPGRRTRLEALKHAAREAVVVVYGVFAMLVLAAAVEAFWSSARWVAPSVKYGVGAACWFLVLAYLGWQGRPLGGVVATAESTHAD